MTHALKAVNFSYVAEEDRILATINPGDPAAWACWLTRRLVLALLAPAAEFLASTSALIQRAPADVRGELASFEREAAMAATDQAMSVTPAEVLKASARAAELGVRLTIVSQADHFRVELLGDKGGEAAGMLARPELQRVLQMLQAEAAKADWFVAPAVSMAQLAAQEPGPIPIRH
jgi:hypothetical protein